MEGNTAVRRTHTNRNRITQYLNPEPYTLEEYIDYLDHDSFKDDKRNFLFILAAWGIVLGLQLILYYNFF